MPEELELEKVETQESKPAETPLGRTDHTKEPEQEGLASGYSPLATARYRIMKERFAMRKKKK